MVSQVPRVYSRKSSFKKIFFSIKPLISVPLTDLSREIFLKITWFGADLLLFALAAMVCVAGSWLLPPRGVRQASAGCRRVK